LGVAILFIGLWCKLSLSVFLGALQVLFSAGSPKAREQMKVYVALWCWHLLLCRPGWGFE